MDGQQYELIDMDIALRGIPAAVLGGKCTIGKKPAQNSPTRNGAHIPRLFVVVQFGMPLLLLLVTGCYKSSQMATPRCRTRDTSLRANVPNFMQVDDGLYRGGQPTDAGYQILKNMGIRTIITLRVFNHDSDELQAVGFRTYHISVKHAHPETEDVLKFLSIVTNPENKPVFVHCREGVDRTGMMIAIYRMVVQGWDKSKAIDEMKQMGFNDWHVLIERYLSNVDAEGLRRAMVGGPAETRQQL